MHVPNQGEAGISLAALRAMVFATIWQDALALAEEAFGERTGRALVQLVLRNDSLRILVLQRLREAARRHRLPAVPHLLRVLQSIAYGIEIGPHVTVGRGVYFVHPVGVVIGGDSRVGDRVRFLGNATVGTAHDDGYPVLEDRVVVGAGARVLGRIRVGRGAVIGANAVVVRDVPEDNVAVGVPARTRPRIRPRAVRAVNISYRRGGPTRPVRSSR